MEWEGRFNSNTPFRFFRERPDLGVYVDEWTSGRELWDRFMADPVRRDKLERFADDLLGMKRPPSHPADALRLADSADAYFGL